MTSQHPDVFVGPSIYRDLNVRTATALMTAMMNNPTPGKVVWAPIWNDALIGRSRSLMCTSFLDTNADVMVIVDDDIVFEWPDFWKIVEGARETHGIYGGAYVTRSTTPHISSRSFPGGEEQVFAQTPQRRPIEYQYLATGFFAIHRDVVEAMADAEFEDAYGTHKVEQVQLGGDKPFYPFFSPFVCREEDDRLHYLSEDWAFCNRARQLGFRVWVDLSIILIHMGQYPYTVRDLETLKEPGLPSKGIDVLKAESTYEPSGDPLLDNLIDDIAEFSEDDPGDVRRMLPGAREELFKLWLGRKEKEADWYQREDVGYHYLADLAHWHRQGFGELPEDFVNQCAGQDVIDFGAGNGQLALQFARAGAHVTACEINPVMRRFIDWRAEKYGLDVEVVGLLDDLFLEVFDVAVAWHVFEHIKDHEDALDRLLSHLKPHGCLVTQSGFTDGATPMHHVRDDWYDVLASRGLRGSSNHLDSDGYPWVFAIASEAVPA